MKRALATLLLLSVAACGSGGGGRPSSLPPVSPSASSSASPGPSAAPGSSAAPSTAASSTATTPGTGPPAVPAGAQAFTREGAEAFARYWFDVLNQAYAEVDPSGIQRISDPACGTCKNFLNSVETAVHEGKTYQGGEFQVVQAAAAPLEDKGAAVLVTLDVPELKVFDRSGALINRVAAARRAAFDIELIRASDKWMVHEMIRS